MSAPEEIGVTYITDVLRKRCSPRDFSDRAIEAAKLYNLFQAARWAASCFNEQPWRFVTATKEDPEGFARLLNLLVEKNQQWAKNAFLIGFTAGKKTFTHSGGPNRFGFYDVAAAGAFLATEAVAVGLQAHFMGGFDAARARTEFGVPDDFEVGAAFVVGYPADPVMPCPPRTRKSLDEIVFGPEWGKPAPVTHETVGFVADCKAWDQALNEIILKADFDGAYAAWYADDVVMQENSDEPRVGKSLNRAREAALMATVEALQPVQLLSSAVDGMRSFSEWVYDFTFAGGKRVKVEEISIRLWKDGLVVQERFYHQRQM